MKQTPPTCCCEVSQGVVVADHGLAVARAHGEAAHPQAAHPAADVVLTTGLRPRGHRGQEPGRGRGQGGQGQPGPSTGGHVARVEAEAGLEAACEHTEGQ